MGLDGGRVTSPRSFFLLTIKLKGEKEKNTEDVKSNVGALKLPLKLVRQSGWSSVGNVPRERKFSVCFSRTNSQEIFHGIERGSERGFLSFFFPPPLEKVGGESKEAVRRISRTDEKLVLFGEFSDREIVPRFSSLLVNNCVITRPPRMKQPLVKSFRIFNNRQAFPR